MRFKLATVSLGVLTLLAGAPASFYAQTAPGTSPAAPAGAAPRPGEPVTLNFANAEIGDVARAISVMTNRNVVVDPRVKGSINLNTDRPVTPAAAYNLFLGALRLQGYTVTESSGIYKVVPEADAKLQAGPVSVAAAGVETTAPGNQILTQIFRLNYETANNLVPILRPLISPNNTINVNPGNNSLVITDYADNLRRIARIIAAMDLPNASDIEVITLKNAIASDLAPLVARLVDGGAPAAPAAGQGQTDTSVRSAIIAEPRSNSLILRAANPARLALIRSVVEKLDQPNAQNPNGNIYVVYLKNAEAARLATTLRAALASMVSGTNVSGAASGGAVVPVPPPNSGGINGSNTGVGQGAGGTTVSTANIPPSTGGQIQADTATNSLIITAPEPQYRQLRAVIDKLDARRAQVYVESLIAEVNADKAAEFGIQWQGPIGRNGDGTIGLLGTNFGAGGSNIFSLATGIARGGVTPSPGLNIGAAQRVNGTYILGFLARFLETNGDGNILSTPNLLTLDNEEAKIVVGQNVPFVTGQYTNNNATGGNVNPFQTIERKDVGLTLRVRPQISENGTIKLAIYQEISTVQPSSVNSVSGLITNKRSIESTVLVEDGAVVVLGGLLQDQYTRERDQVPGLGNIPIFGNLFKSENRSRSKTNLMVFLRPVVVRDGPAAETYSADRYNEMRAVQIEQQPVRRELVPVDGAAVLPLRPSRILTTPAPAAPATAAPANPGAPAKP